MAYLLPRTIGEIKACVQKLIEEDTVPQQATIDLAVQFDNASTAKDYMRKAYEKCNDIPQETRALIETFLNEKSWKDYEMHNAFRSPEMMRVGSLSDHPLINYGLHTLQKDD
ncbi:hypothetical protein Tco_0822585 [Tanacetum coccineum]|uniref:Uncharacterized protein n=1 Tax=Tanacetum coccineum TaxID=301880 RepID=A0ABQ5AFH6_9ASTR